MTGRLSIGGFVEAGGSCNVPMFTLRERLRTAGCPGKASSYVATLLQVHRGSAFLGD